MRTVGAERGGPGPSARRPPFERPAPAWGRPALAVGGGVALGLAFPPFDLAPLAFVGVAAFLASLRGIRATTRILLGFVFGLAFFGLLLLWVRRAGLHAYVALVATESVFPSLFALAAGPVLDRRSSAATVGASALWILIMEAARSRFPLGGFPWGSLGLPVVGTPLALIAPLGGGIAVAWVIAYLSAALASFPRARLRSGLATIAPALALVGLGLPFLGQPSVGQELRVAVVQGNVPLPPELASPPRTARVLADHVALTRAIAPGSVDLVVWPEGVVDLDVERPSPGQLAPPPLAGLARETGAWIVAGVVSDAGPGRFRNSAVAVDPSGSVAGVYDKQRPVPFGEYVPGRPFLGFITALRAVPADMVPGSGPRPLPVPGGPIGTPISYEVAFSRIVQRFAAEGARAVVVPTNTSSFGPRAATAEQQLQATRMRALELGLWVVQSAPSGISAIVDPRGRVVERTDLYEAAVLRSAIRLADPSTPFARWGEGPSLLLASSAVLWFLVSAAPGDRARTGAG